MNRWLKISNYFLTRKRCTGRMKLGRKFISSRHKLRAGFVTFVRRPSHVHVGQSGRRTGHQTRMNGRSSCVVVDWCCCWAMGHNWHFVGRRKRGGLDVGGRSCIFFIIHIAFFHFRVVKLFLVIADFFVNFARPVTQSKVQSELIDPMDSRVNLP